MLYILLYFLLYLLLNFGRFLCVDLIDDRISCFSDKLLFLFFYLLCRTLLLIFFGQLFDAGAFGELCRRVCLFCGKAKIASGFFCSSIGRLSHG